MANETLQREKMSFEELPFESALLPCQNVFDKCTTNTELGNGESFIKKWRVGPKKIPTVIVG